jgi:transglutaminase-like putative cysteine protease
MIACLRSLGLPARYVSGYLRSGEKAIGAVSVEVLPAPVAR